MYRADAAGAFLYGRTGEDPEGVVSFPGIERVGDGTV